MEKKLTAKKELKYEKPKLIKIESAHGVACALGLAIAGGCSIGAADVPVVCTRGGTPIS